MGLFISQKRKKVSSKNETEKYRFAEKKPCGMGIR